VNLKLGADLSSRFLFTVDWQTGFLPGIESADERPDLVISMFLKFSRQTGA
jgi:hypothetical protein